MGFDIYGTAPTTEHGEYWRSSASGWSALWRWVASVSPTAQLLGDKMYWNDGACVTQDAALAMANEIDAEIEQHGLPLQSQELVAERAALDPTPADERMSELMFAFAGARVVNMLGDDYVARRITAFSKFCRESGGFTVL